MFIETHIDNNIALTFLKSVNVQVFPCGRRQSNEKTTNEDNKGNVLAYRIPFDPEARLNTEANNRKHSSLNGYTQTYLKEWDENNGLLTMSLAGYLFTIKLGTVIKGVDPNNKPESGEAKDPNIFGQGTIYSLLQKVIAEAKGDAEKIDKAKTAFSNATAIYANIRLENVHLFSGFEEYYTPILRNQTTSATPETSLDLLKSGINSLSEGYNFENFYFSGLSFSTTPLAAKSADEGYTFETRDSVLNVFEKDGRTVTQQITSLCILKKVVVTGENGETVSVWEINQQALLPNIKHGETKDSIEVEGNALFKTTVDIKEKLSVKNDGSNALIDADEATITNVEVSEKIVTKNLKSTGLIEANKIGTEKDENGIGGRVGEIYAVESDIDKLTVNTELNATTLNATTLNASDIQQKIDNEYCDVPVIFVEKQTNDNKTEYQLKISRVNKINFDAEI